jgi:flagella basal body P-ring formation protein FlgA
MKYFLGLLTFFSLNLWAEPCNLELPAKIYRLDKNQNILVKDIVKNSTCNDEINNKVISLLSNSNGDIFVSSLENQVGNQNLHITPRKVNVSNLADTFREQLTAESNLYFFDIKSVGQASTLNLEESDSIRTICESCNSYGNKNIKVEITNNLTGNIKAFWFSSKIFAKVKVIKAKQTLSFQQKSLSAQDFFQDETYTMLPDNLLGSLENIQFYKPTKTIMAGTIVTNMDIAPVNLVTYGTPAKVVLKNQTINLVKMATPIRSAQYGESVELKVGNNKTITGKVIDFNQVVIEL